MHSLLHLYYLRMGMWFSTYTLPKLSGNRILLLCVARHVLFRNTTTSAPRRTTSERRNLALQRRLRYAKLKGNACVRRHRLPRPPRPRSHAHTLAGQRLRLGWRHKNIFLAGPTGIGGAGWPGSPWRDHSQMISQRLRTIRRRNLQLRKSMCCRLACS
jgi:hypothetical protein